MGGGDGGRGWGAGMGGGGDRGGGGDGEGGGEGEGPTSPLLEISADEVLLHNTGAGAGGQAISEQETVVRNPGLRSMRGLHPRGGHHDRVPGVQRDGGSDKVGVGEGVGEGEGNGLSRPGHPPP